MKRLSFAIMLALCTMGVWAQEGIKVEFEGANPNIFDFAWSYLINYDPNTEGDFWHQRRTGALPSEREPRRQRDAHCRQEGWFHQL